MFVRRFRDGRSQCPTYKAFAFLHKTPIENLSYLDLRKDKQMKPISRLVTLACFLLAFTFFVKVVSASGPTAVYALIDKVTLEPNADRPQRIVIYGVFSSAENAGNAYSEPQRGYLCFTLPTQNSELALREWSDLKSVAGTRQVVAFGSGWMAKVRVRKSSAQAANDPDPYTLNFGVKKLNADEPHAKALLDYKGR
jgi:hypothetical protein